MATQQDTETDILARAVERLSQDLADERIRCERYRRALVSLSEITAGVGGWQATVEHAYAVARKALNP